MRWLAVVVAIGCGHGNGVRDRDRVGDGVRVGVRDGGGNGDGSGVVDLHVDLAYALRAKPLAETQASPERMRAGGVTVFLAPLFVNDAFAMTPEAARAAYEVTYARLGKALPMLPARALLSFEGADGFAEAPEAIDAWMARGACVVGLVHDHANALGGASQDPRPAARARGLSVAGKALAARIVAHGGLLDVAHASDATFDDLAAIAREAKAPLIDTHTGARALRDIPRNLDDSRMAIVGASGGVIGISMHRGHIGSTPGDPATLADVATHVLHAIAVAGREHVAIGSDFDGAIDPPEHADESIWPRFHAELRSRGLSDADIDAVFHGNAMRVLAWPVRHGCTPGAR